MVARSSLLRRAFRHASSVVAALAALAPRLVRLAHHDYPDGLLGGSRQQHRERRADAGRAGDPDVSPVRLDDRLRDEETEAGPLRALHLAHAAILLEEAGGIVGRGAAPGIAGGAGGEARLPRRAGGGPAAGPRVLYGGA